MRKRAAKPPGVLSPGENIARDIRSGTIPGTRSENDLRTVSIPHTRSEPGLDLDLDLDAKMSEEPVPKTTVRLPLERKKPAKKAAGIVPAIRSADEILQSLDVVIDNIDAETKKPSAPRKKAANRTVEKLPDGIEPPKPKRPGRPKKVILKQPVPRQGIVREPSNLREANGTDEAYIYEIIYENPLMFKKIFNACKAIEAVSVRLRFDANDLYVYACNENNTRVLGKVIGSRINSYYCGNPGLQTGLKLDPVIGVLGTMSNENSRIQINTKQRLQHEKVKIVGSNDQAKQRTEYEVNVQTLPDYDWSIEEELSHEEEYPITFEIGFKEFKKLVSDAKTCGAEVMHLEKESEGFLRFSYVLADNNGRGDVYLYDNKHIKLRSKMDEGDIFSSSVFLDHIKGLSSSLISDTVEISADPNRNMILTSYLDHDMTDDKKIIPNTEKAIVKFVVDIVRA